MKINKLSAGFVVMSIMGTVSVFAMDIMTDKMDDKMMMKDKMATGTMMKDDKMMADKMMMSDDMMMKITKKSGSSEISKLQQHLIEKGFLKVRAGTKLGYYGPLTINAFKKYEASMMAMKKDSMMKDDKMMGDKMMSTSTTK